MALWHQTAPASEPISTSVAKLHLRVDASTDDALIDTLCAAARRVVETITRRKCITQTWDLKLDAFPDGAIWLSCQPVTSVTSITYTDTNGDSQTLSSALYTTDLPPGEESPYARIVPAYQQVWPQTRDVVNAVTVRFVCGFATAAAVPAAMMAAMKLLISHWYENRESVVVGTINSELEQGLNTLLWPCKVWP